MPPLARAWAPGARPRSACSRSRSCCRFGIDFVAAAARLQANIVYATAIPTSVRSRTPRQVYQVHLSEPAPVIEGGAEPVAQPAGRSTGTEDFTSGAWLIMRSHSLIKWLAAKGHP